MDEKSARRTVELPASRAFVVQFAASAGDEIPFRGRIEHLSSGSVTHFESLTQRGELLVRVFAPTSAAEPDPARPNDRQEDVHGTHER